MTQGHEENATFRLMQELRDSLFRPVSGDSVDMDHLENAFASLQRENFHLRLWIEVAQLYSYRFIKDRLGSVENVALFHGGVLVAVKTTLLQAGASSAEVYNYMFGGAAENNPSVVYSYSCMEFAKYATSVHLSLANMQNAVLRKVTTPVDDPVDSALRSAENEVIDDDWKKKSN